MDAWAFPIAGEFPIPVTEMECPTSAGISADAATDLSLVDVTIDIRVVSTELPIVAMLQKGGINSLSCDVNGQSTDEFVKSSWPAPSMSTFSDDVILPVSAATNVAVLDVWILL